MNHLKWMGHCTTIFDIQRQLRKDQQTCDVTLVAKGHSVRAHRFVLSSCSDLMRALLADVPMGHEATIVVPDVKGTLLDCVLEFVYIGETRLGSSNLSEFLEAINILGIKSAISFECNTNTLAPTATATAPLPVKTLSNIQIEQEELIEQEQISEQKLESHNIAEQQTTTRELEFLDVYQEAQHKITYSIDNTGHEYILTENSGTFTLTQNPKLENASSSNSEKMADMEDDAEDSQIIEYSDSADPIIELPENVNQSADDTASPAASASAPPSLTPVIKMKSKVKSFKIKAPLDTSESQLHQVMAESSPSTFNTSLTNPISKLEDTALVEKLTTHSFSDAASYALDLALQAVINEGLSLQKAAQKYDVSKTVLWRRVRKHPNYMKTARENPVLTLAYERLKDGDSLKNISRELDIPMSTLHRHKVRLAQQGRLPNYLTFKKRDPATKDELREKLAKAVHACVHDGMSQNHAANLFDIPKSTLWRHLQKRVAEAELSVKIEQEDVEKEQCIKQEMILP